MLQAYARVLLAYRMPEEVQRAIAGVKINARANAIKPLAFAKDCAQITGAARISPACFCDPKVRFKPSQVHQAWHMVYQDSKMLDLLISIFSGYSARR